MINRIINKLKKLSTANVPQLSALDSLSLLPRYTPGEFVLDGINLVFPDAASFVSIYKELFHNEIYKFETQNESPLIIDCGANVGLSVIYFKKHFPTSRIIAFEPDPEIYSYLQRNLNSSACDQDVEVYNVGLWESEGTLTFKNEGADAGRISFEHDKSAFKGNTEIKTVKLSSYINSKVDLLKIDIEGAEVKVIQEVESKLFHVDKIFIEYHSFVNSHQELDVILSILTRNNFEYYLDFPSRLRRYPFIDNSAFLSFNLLVNIFAKRNS